jgi:hypothetical protein
MKRYLIDNTILTICGVLTCVAILYVNHSAIFGFPMMMSSLYMTVYGIENFVKEFKRVRRK